MTLRSKFVHWIDKVTRQPSTCLGCRMRSDSPDRADVRMVEGPKYGICERCHAEAMRLVGRTGPGAAYPDNDKLSHCHFCGTPRDTASGLVGWPRGAICRDCLVLCQGLFTKPAS